MPVSSPTTGMTVLQIVELEQQLKREGMERMKREGIERMAQEKALYDQKHIKPMVALELCPLCKQESPENKICPECVSDGISEADKWMKEHGGN